MLIEDYLKNIDETIRSSPYVISSKIANDKRSLYIAFIEGEIQFVNQSVLYFMEFVDVSRGVDKYKYRYHYQDKDGIRIFRYDMAPHHQKLATFPHHKHIGPEGITEKVIESVAPTLGEVINEISITFSN